ncbi:MAG: ParB/RepB/Spo0J family partition protein [Thermodesulfobacteriota bacterium]|nr:ParB/RepB/Spo0J family partition protein [Thermodesulfobacteriota bacterium]
MKVIQKVPLRQIDLSDETFSVNFMPDLQNLRSSIEEIGLIQPVLLMEKSDGYQIVCGFRRISILNELGGTEVESRLFEGKEKDDLRLFSISLHENLTARGFNAVEKAMALEKLVHHFGVDRIDAIKKFLPFFSLEPNEKILDTFLSLARMEDEVKQYVLKEKVSRSNIRMLSAFPPEDRTVLVRLFSFLKLGENRLKEILGLLEEISRRDRCGVKEIVRRPEMDAALFQKELTPSQKTDRVKKILMNLRHPMMRQKEEAFERKTKALNLPPGVSLHHSPFFEGKGLNIGFQFETLEELQTILSSLSLLSEKKELKEIINNH